MQLVHIGDHIHALPAEWWRRDGRLLIRGLWLPVRGGSAKACARARARTPASLPHATAGRAATLGHAPARPHGRTARWQSRLQRHPITASHALHQHETGRRRGARRRTSRTHRRSGGRPGGRRPIPPQIVPRLTKMSQSSCAASRPPRARAVTATTISSEPSRGHRRGARSQPASAGARRARVAPRRQSSHEMSKRWNSSQP